MNQIKGFFRDESATAEASSTVIMIAAVGLLLAVGLMVWYGKLNGFFDTTGGNITNSASSFAMPLKLK